MRIPTVHIICLLALVAPASAAEPFSAFDALKLLPKEQAANLARIEAREGMPAPERWYLIVHEPGEQNGVREFAIAGGEIVASRTISQFVETVTADDVIGGEVLKVDSGQAAKLAQEYARANNLAVRAFNYELKKEGRGAAPVWRVTCLDNSGGKVGAVTVTAGNGPAKSSPPGRKKQPKLSTYAETQVVKAQPSPPREAPRRRVEEPSGIEKVGNTLRRFFGGGH